MLQKLVIHNYAIIDDLALAPDANLNTVTGETGAGKSIILGALSLILGARADTSVLINKEEKCVVEAHFSVAENKQFRKAIVAEDLDDETQCIIRREISTSGKSRAFVNDTPVTLQVLNKLTSILVDLHQQFDHLSLEDNHFQMDVLDAVGQHGNVLNEYRIAYKEYKAVAQELAEKQSQQAKWQQEADYKTFLLDELQQAAFAEEEIEQAEQQLKQMAHAERIVTILQSSRYALEEGEHPLNNELRRIQQQLQSITDVMPDADALQQRIASAYAELKDISGELESLEDKVSLDPALMERLQERMDLGYRLQKKHNVKGTAELLALQQQLEGELQTTQNLQEDIAALTQRQADLQKAVVEIAQKLTKMRTKVAPAISAQVTELLGKIGMPNAQFQISLAALEAPGAMGLDAVQFLLDANKSGKFQSVQKAASGGEMSRIMLAIKSLTAKAMELPILIFDEVDTGISGEAARQVGILLQSLAQYHQVICITHQPQVAARGVKHFFVYKDAGDDGRIRTRVKTLQAEERVLAIARMIGGEKPSAAALQNAKELVTE